MLGNSPRYSLPFARLLAGLALVLTAAGCEMMTAGTNLLAQAASRLADAAQEAYTVGLTDDAKHYLELALTVTPDALAWRELRESWD